MDPQHLSTVINVPIVNSFLSSDHNHLSIFDTLLESRITGVDSEIRTEYENGIVTRFPVLILCLDGLERLLEKHGSAKELLEEKIRAEGGQPGVYGRLVQSLPIARTGILSGGDERNAVELEALKKKKWEFEYAEENRKLKEKLETEYATSYVRLKQEMETSFREQLAKRETELQAEAALELAKLKTEVLTDATKDVAIQSDGLAEECARCKKLREEDVVEQLAKEKEKLEKQNVQVLAKLRQDLKDRAADDINDWKRRLRARNEEEIAKLKNKIRDDAHEAERKLAQKQRSENAANLKKAKEQLEKETAEELAKLKEDLKNEAANDLNEWKRQLGMKNSEDSAKDRNKLLAEEIFKEKEKLGIAAAKELSMLQMELREHSSAVLRQVPAKVNAKVNRMVENRLSSYNMEFQKRMDINRRKFIEYRNKCIFDINDSGMTIHLTDKAAVKLLAKSPTIFNNYKDLCLEALRKYKKELKEQYQDHLKDIELECRAWLRQTSGSGLRVEVIEGIQKAIARGRSFQPRIASIDEDVGSQITREVLRQEADEMVAELEAQHQKSVCDGGFGLPTWDTQVEVLNLAIDDADISGTTDILADNSLLDNMAERTFLGTPLKELQVKARQVTSAKNIHINVPEPQNRWERTEPTVCNTDQGKALGKLSNSSLATRLESVELRERRANTEPELRQKNHSNAICEMGPPKLRPASLWYSAKENVPMPTSDANQATNMLHGGAVPPTEPKDRDSCSTAKGSEANSPIDEFRSAREIDEISKLAEIESPVEDILQSEPLASRAFASTQEIFETMYNGKTVSEIYEILKDKQVKRKRLSNSDESDIMPLCKKTV